MVEPASVHASDHPYAYAPAAFPAAGPAGPGGPAGPAGPAPRRSAPALPAEMQPSAICGSPRDAGLHLGAVRPEADGRTRAADDRVPAAAGWAAVAEACRPHGTLVLAGLAHAGGQGSTAHSGHPLWGPSPVPDVVSRETPVAMGPGEIGALVAAYADAARSAVDSGVDGVEISAGQHSLLRQFCSGLTNHRGDRYGTDRSSLLREVLGAVRDAIGPGPLLALRLCVDELAPWAGIRPDDGVALARAVAPMVDLLVPVVGSAPSVGATRPDLHTPEAFLRERCAELRSAVAGAAPVVLAGSVASVSIASDVLTSGDADLVEMTRAQIADPRLVALTRAGTPARIRPCVLTHALAAARDPRNPVVGDELEPRSGHERAEPDPAAGRPGRESGTPDTHAQGGRPPEHRRPEHGPPEDRPREDGPPDHRQPDHWPLEDGSLDGGPLENRPLEEHSGGPVPVLVVGGGPAGLEAARTLALRGHPVTVHERADRLGGALHAAAAVPGRSRLGLPVAWWERELARLGVAVELGSAPDAAALAAAETRGETVLLATGSRPAPVQYAADVPVLLAAELFAAVADRGRAVGGGRSGVAHALGAAGVAAGAAVLVRDPLGDWTGPGAAELLAAAGYAVTLSTPDAVAGHQLGRCGDMAPANARLERAGVVRALFTDLRRVAGGVAELADVHTGAVTRVPCAAVVDCGARLADRTLPDGPGRPSAGDRVAPRTLAEAVREGRRAALRIAGASAVRASEPLVPGAGRSSSGADPVPGPAGRAAAGSPRPGAGSGAGVVTRSREERPRPTTGGGRGRAASLTDPVRLGRHTLRNRIVFTAHLTGFAEGGLPGERHAAYYAARAAGGAGLVITEEHAVHPHDRPYERLIRGHDPAVLPGYRRITDAVHGHGAVVLAQLNHNGAQGSGMYSREAVVGPSALPDPMFREVPAELDAAGIAGIVAGFADVAARCVAGGFDGVELQCSHASLLRLFLSPATNRRTDAWGGDRARRARLVLDVVAAVRAAIGPEPVLGLRIGADERVPGGITPDDGADLARRLVATGAVDHLNTSIGVATSTLHLIEPSMHTPAGYAGYLAATLRRAVRDAGSDIPVIGVGRFTTPGEAAAALERGECDLVGVARGQIADPEFAAKAVAGRPVRRCVGCNQDCIGRVGLNLPLRCAVNPAAGRERLLIADPQVPLRRGSALHTPAHHPGAAGPGTQAAGRRRTVLVVGAGPAGLSAAASLAARGDRVLLAERAAGPGGRLALAAGAPGRAELGHVVTDLLRAAREAGATVRFGLAVDPDVVAEQQPDAVVLATGAAPAAPHWDPKGLTVPVDAVLAGARLPDGPVLVVDELGFHHATSTAELLAARGHDVEIVTPALVVGQDLGLTLDREGFRRRAHAVGIRCSTDRAVLRVVRPGEQSRARRIGVELLHHPTGRVEHREVAAVVTALPAVPRARLWTELGDSHPRVHRIGDALAPRRMDAAIREGAAVLT